MTPFAFKYCEITLFASDGYSVNIYYFHKIELSLSSRHKIWRKMRLAVIDNKIGLLPFVNFIFIKMDLPNPC